jgi:hypothetical protein
MDLASKLTVECPRCDGGWMHYPHTHQPNDPATCQRCGHTYAYGDLLEVAQLRRMSLIRAEGHSADFV